MAYTNIPGGSTFGLCRKMLRTMLTELYNGGGITTNVDIAGTLDVTGATTLDTTLTVVGVADAATLQATTAVVLKDAAGDILVASGTTVPADTTTGYAKGCLFIDTDVVTGTSGLYVNVGINTSCVFKLVTNAA